MAWTDRTFSASAVLAGAHLNEHRDNFREVGRSYVMSTATTDVASSSTETSIFSQSIAANDLSTDRLLRLTVFGDYLHNNGTGDTLTVRLKLGATTILSDTTNFSATIGAGRQPWQIEALLANAGATNSQYASLRLIAPPANEAAPGTGIGDLEGITLGLLGNSAAAAEDTTAARTLDLTVQWSVLHANNSFRKRYAILELLQ